MVDRANGSRASSNIRPILASRSRFRGDLLLWSSLFAGDELSADSFLDLPSPSLPALSLWLIDSLLLSFPWFIAWTDRSKQVLMRSIGAFIVTTFHHSV